jgi:tetratricopeptide (TPR) repeat protein
LRSFGSSLHFAGDRPLAERVWEESLSIYESEGNEHGIAVQLHRLSICALEKGDVELARQRAERSLELHRGADNEKGACQPVSLLGTLALQSGDVDAGVLLLEESATLAERAGWRFWQAGTKSALADVSLARGQVDEAKDLLRESIAVACQVHDRVGLSWYLSQFALACAMEGETREAGRIWGAVESSRAFIPGGPWPRDYAELEQRVRGLADDDFENGSAEGRAMTLEDVAARSVPRLNSDAPAA